MESTLAKTSQPQVTVGVDTHKQFHVAHAVDALGRPRLEIPQHKQTN